MKIYGLPLVFLVLVGCATMPLIVADSPDYVAVGSVRSDLKGHSFYLAIGQVDLYRHRAFGGVASIGRVAESPAALRVDRATGKVERMVTLQEVAEQKTTTATSINSVTTIVHNKRSYVLGELIGGMSIIDVHPHSSWLESLAAMRKAAEDMGSSGNFRVSTDTSVSTTVFSPPIIRWFPRRWHHFPDHRHRR